MTWWRKLIRRKRGDVTPVEAAEVREDAARGLVDAKERAELARKAVSQSREARTAYFTNEVRKAIGGGRL